MIHEMHESILFAFLLFGSIPFKMSINVLELMLPRLNKILVTIS